MNHRKYFTFFSTAKTRKSQPLLVVVASGAFEGEPEEGRAKGMHAVRNVLDAEFLRHASSFHLLGVESVEAGG